VCLLINGNIYPEPTIAKKDILVYTIRLHYNPTSKTCFSPFYTCFEWEFGKKYYTEWDENFPKNYFLVHKGFHSFRFKADAEKVRDELLNKYKESNHYVYRSIVPKDSKYFYGTIVNCSPAADYRVGYISDTLITTNERL